MTDVRDLLRADARRAGPPDRIDPDAIWAGVRRRRHRRWTIATTVAVIAAAALPVGILRLSGTPPTPRSAVSSPAPTIPVDAKVVWAPPEATVRAMPETVDPTSIGLPTAAEIAAAPPAGDRPLTARMVFWPSESSDLYAVADDGTVYRLDHLAFEANKDTDLVGYGQPTLLPTSLSADGTRLALRQSANRLLLVDLHSWTSRDLPAPNDSQTTQVCQFAWTSDGGVYVTATDGSPGGRVESRYLAASTSKWRPGPPGGVDLIATDGTRISLHDSSAPEAAPPSPATVTGYAGESVRGSTLEVPWFALWGNLRRDAALHGSQLATSTGQALVPGAKVLPAQGLIAMRQLTEELRAVLAFDYADGYSKGCCNLIGWVDDDTILADIERAAYTWDLDTGTLARLLPTPALRNASFASDIP